MSKAKTILNYALGVVIIPLLVSVYIVDRIVMIPFVWIPNRTLGKWYGDGIQMYLSIIRVVIAFIVYMIYLFIGTFIG